MLAEGHELIQNQRDAHGNFWVACGSLRSLLSRKPAGKQDVRSRSFTAHEQPRRCVQKPKQLWKFLAAESLPVLYHFTDVGCTVRYCRKSTKSWRCLRVHALVLTWRAWKEEIETSATCGQVHTVDSVHPHRPGGSVRSGSGASASLRYLRVAASCYLWPTTFSSLPALQSSRRRLPSSSVDPSPCYTVPSSSALQARVCGEISLYMLQAWQKWREEAMPASAV